MSGGGVPAQIFQPPKSDKETSAPKRFPARKAPPENYFHPVLHSKWEVPTDERNMMDIRKADSKGRMTGFTPGAYYRIWKEGGFRFKADKVTLLESEEAYLNATEDGRPPEAAQNYLRRFGIEPSSVSVEDLMELGYTSFVLDENGKRVNDYGVFKTERKPWPEGFSWNEFVGLLVDTP